MLSRRHIRLKVMQSLYAYFSTKENNIPASEEAMLKHIEEIGELNLVILSLLVELVKYADNFFEDGKKKHLPTAEDLDPNRRFVDNQVITLIREDDALMDKINKVSGFWLKNDYNVRLLPSTQFVELDFKEKFFDFDFSGIIQEDIINFAAFETYSYIKMDNENSKFKCNPYNIN